jgi:hypothetical protein
MIEGANITSGNTMPGRWDSERNFSARRESKAQILLLVGVYRLWRPFRSLTLLATRLATRPTSTMSEESRTTAANHKHTLSGESAAAYLVVTHVIVCLVLILPSQFAVFSTSGSPLYLAIIIMVILHAHATRYYTKDLAATVYIPHVLEYFGAWFGIFVTSKSYCVDVIHG